eukprot:208787-Rhodomonas_salina.1
MSLQNKQDDTYTYGVARWDPSHHIPNAAYSTICLNVKHSREYLEGAAVDSESASPIDIQNNTDQVQLTCGLN